MLIKPHIFRVRLFDRWWYGYAIAGRQPTLARSVRQLQEWFGSNQPGWREPPKTWSSHYWRWLETPWGRKVLVEMDHLNQKWSSQPGWFWAKEYRTLRETLVRLTTVERGKVYVREHGGLSGPRPLSPVNGSTSETHSTRLSSPEH